MSEMDADASRGTIDPECLAADMAEKERGLKLSARVFVILMAEVRV